MRLSKAEQESLLKSYNTRWPHERVEWIDNEFLWVTTGEDIDNPDPELYPLLGHVCDITKLDGWGVRFYWNHLHHLSAGNQLDEEFKCYCDPCPFPRALRMRVKLLTMKGI